MPKPSIKERKQALREQGCVNCGQPYGDTHHLRRIELDHITPWGDLPEEHRDDLDELQPLCGRCNRYKNRYTYQQLNLHQIPNYPKGFDWATLEWVETQLSETDRQYLDQHGQDDDFNWNAFAQAATYVEVSRTPAKWIHGELFDIPIWPSDANECRVPIHDTPQYSSTPQKHTGREK